MKKTIFLTIFALTSVSLVIGCSDSKKASYQFLPSEYFLDSWSDQGNSIASWYLTSGIENTRKDEIYKKTFTTGGDVLSQWVEAERDDNGYYDVSNLKKLKGNNPFGSILRNPFGIEVKDYIPFNDINAVRNETIDFRHRYILGGKLVEVDAPLYLCDLKIFFGKMVFRLAEEIKKSYPREFESEEDYLAEAYHIYARAGYIRLKDADDIEQGLILVRPLSIAEILGFNWNEVLSQEDYSDNYGIDFSIILEKIQNKIARDKKQAEDLKIKPRTAFTEYELRCIGFGFKNDDVDACVKQEKFYDKRIKDQEVIFSYKLEQQKIGFQRKLDQLDDDTSFDVFSLGDKDRQNRELYNLQKQIDDLERRNRRRRD